MTIHRAAVVLALTLVLGASTGGLAAAQDPDRRAGAWDRSVKAEQANDLPRARAALADAYGEAPDSYEVALRLAWLSLRLKKGEAAATLYRLAARLDGAGPEATQGLADALTLTGFDAFARGDRATARARWLEALRVNPSCADAPRGLDLIGPVPTVTPEVWGGYLTSSQSASAAQAIYLHAPAQVTDQVGVRFAYRHIGSTAGSTGGGATSTSTSLFGQQDEFYAGATFARSYLGVQVIGFALRSPDETVPGAAVALRVGARYGVSLTAASMSRSTGANRQIMPQIYVWPTPYVGLTTGARVTNDSDGSTTSAVVGATVIVGRALVDLQAHTGTERWAFSMAGPTVMSLFASSKYGGTLTAGFELSRTASLYLQAQYEHITQPGTSVQDGRYTGLSVGFRWSPKAGKKDGR
jgi:tetratricopeptide (TPR) repeat protein